MNQSNGGESYSLWFIPEGELYKEIKSDIERAAAHYGTVRFEPHVTLLPDVKKSAEEVVQKATELARALPPFTLTVRGAETGSSFFKCVFLTFEESPEILRANRAARSAFGRADAAPYLPHLSVLYGDDVPLTIKNEVARAMQKYRGKIIEAKNLFVYSAHEAPDGWRQIAKIPLSGK